jgi:hypothetical protein
LIKIAFNLQNTKHDKRKTKIHEPLIHGHKKRNNMSLFSGCHGKQLNPTDKEMEQLILCGLTTDYLLLFKAMVRENQAALCRLNTPKVNIL